MSTKRHRHVESNGCRMVLQDMELMYAIISFQDGIPLDLYTRVQEVYQFILVRDQDQLHDEISQQPNTANNSGYGNMHGRSMKPNAATFKFPATFRQLRNYPQISLSIDDVQVVCTSGYFRDARLPLHIAIIEGELEIVKKFCQYKPRIVTRAAIHRAIDHGQYEIALWIGSFIKCGRVLARRNRAMAANTGQNGWRRPLGKVSTNCNFLGDVDSIYAENEDDDRFYGYPYAYNGSSYVDCNSDDDFNDYIDDNIGDYSGANTSANIGGNSSGNSSGSSGDNTDESTGDNSDGYFSDEDARIDDLLSRDGNYLRGTYRDGRDVEWYWYYCLAEIGELCKPFQKIQEHITKYYPYHYAMNALQVDDLRAFKTIIKKLSKQMCLSLLLEAHEMGKIPFINVLLRHRRRQFCLEDELPQKGLLSEDVKVLEFYRKSFNLTGRLAYSYDVMELITTGNLETFRWLYNNQYSQLIEVIEKSHPVKVENLEMAKYLYRVKFPLDKIWPLTIHVAKYLVWNNVHITHQHLFWAVGGPPVKLDYRGRRVLENLHQEGMPWTWGLPDRSDMKQLFRHGKNLFEILIFYLQNIPNLVLTQTHVDIGVRLGAVEFVQFIHHHNTLDLNHTHLEAAIQFGHFKVVKYMHEVIGWPIPAHALAWAIRSCDRFEDVEYKAAPLVEYLVQSQKQMVWKINQEPTHCSSDTIRWLIKNCQGSDKWDILYGCVRFGNLNLLKFVAERTSVHVTSVSRALDFARDTGSMNLIGFLWNLAVNTWIRNGISVLDECKRNLDRIQQLQATKLAHLPSWKAFTQQIKSTERIIQSFHIS